MQQSLSLEPSGIPLSLTVFGMQYYVLSGYTNMKGLKCRITLNYLKCYTNHLKLLKNYATAYIVFVLADIINK
jgi:hypothetical protein